MRNGRGRVSGPSGPSPWSWVKVDGTILSFWVEHEGRLGPGSGNHEEVGYVASPGLSPTQARMPLLKSQGSNQVSKINRALKVLYIATFTLVG